MPGKLIKLLCDELRGKKTHNVQSLFNAHLLGKAGQKNAKLSGGSLFFLFSFFPVK